MLKSPTKNEIDQLINAGEAFEKNNHTQASAAGSEGFMAGPPDIPSHFIEMFRRLVAASNPGTFPELERAIADAGGPDMVDVLRDLYRARKMV